MEGFSLNALLNSYSVVLVIAGIVVTAFAKCITKIFRMGVTFKADIATKKELISFEEEMRRDMRNYAVQIQKSVGDAMLLVLNNRLKDIEDAKEAVDTIKITKLEIEMQLKAINEKYDNVKNISDEVRLLTNKVQRLEYQNTMNSAPRGTDRRTEN